MAYDMLRLVAETLPRRAAPAVGGHDAHPLEGARRRFATVLLTDMEDSTGLAHRLPLAEYAAIVGEQTAIVIEAIQHTGGRVLSFGGDGLLACWTSTGDDAATARRAVLSTEAISGAIRVLGATCAATGAPFRRLRVGVESGEILVREACDDCGPFAFGAALHRVRALEQAGRTSGDAHVAVTIGATTLALAARASPFAGVGGVRATSG